MSERRTRRARGQHLARRPRVRPLLRPARCGARSGPGRHPLLPQAVTRAGSGRRCGHHASCRWCSPCSSGGRWTCSASAAASKCETAGMRARSSGACPAWMSPDLRARGGRIRGATSAGARHHPAGVPRSVRVGAHPRHDVRSGCTAIEHVAAHGESYVTQARRRFREQLSFYGIEAPNQQRSGTRWNDAA